MEMYHVVIICLGVWVIFCLTRPIVSPSNNDIRFKRHSEQEINRLEQRKTHLGLKKFYHVGGKK